MYSPFLETILIVKVSRTVKSVPRGENEWSDANWRAIRNGNERCKRCVTRCVRQLYKHHVVSLFFALASSESSFSPIVILMMTKRDRCLKNPYKFIRVIPLKR